LTLTINSVNYIDKIPNKKVTIKGEIITKREFSILSIIFIFFLNLFFITGTIYAQNENKNLTSNDWYQKGIKAQVLNKLEEAKLNYNEELKLDPTLCQAYSNIGSIY
jgi:hypothetical protein